MVFLCLNESSGAVLDGEQTKRLRASLANASEWRTPGDEARRLAGVAVDAATLAARIEPLARRRIQDELEPFLAAMRRRFERDRARIHHYHDDLRRAALIKLAGLDNAQGEKAQADRRRETLRAAQVERDYAAKLDDLRHNYAMRVRVEWMQAVTLYCPVDRFEVLIKRRKGERVIHIDWRLSIRAMEPPPCDYGLGAGRARLVCDDALHLTEPAGQASCPACGKVFCRACHGPSCPRCGRADE